MIKCTNSKFIRKIIVEHKKSMFGWSKVLPTSFDYIYTQRNRFSDYFQTDKNLIVRTVLVLIRKPTENCWVHNQKENRHILFILEVIVKLFPSVYKKKSNTSRQNILQSKRL